MMEAPFVMRLMASSVSIANFAGSIIRKVLSSGELGIVDKGINDLQTQADRSVQHCIVSSLSKQFPEICIIGTLLVNLLDINYSNSTLFIWTSSLSPI